VKVLDPFALLSEVKQEHGVAYMNSLSNTGINLYTERGGNIIALYRPDCNSKVRV